MMSQIEGDFSRSGLGAETGALHRAIAYMTGIMLTASMMLGGATHNGYLGDVVLQMLALPLIFLATIELMEHGAPPGSKAPLVFVVLVSMLPILHLMPLPDLLWETLPGRSMIAETFELIDRQRPALPLTMSPPKTWASALAILPPLSIFSRLFVFDRQRTLASYETIDRLGCSQCLHRSRATGWRP